MLLSLTLAQGCADKKKGPPPPHPIDGLEAFGDQTRVLINFDVAKLEASRLVRRGIAEMMARDTFLAERIRGIASDCHLEPGKNVEQLIVGMGEQSSDLLLVVSGRFEENAIAACVQKRLGGSGGQLSTKPVQGRTAYRAVGNVADKASAPVWFALGSPKTLIVAGSLAWLEIGLGKGPRLAAVPLMKARLEAAPTEASVWAVGVVPQKIGEQLSAAVGGDIAPPAAMTARMDFKAGIQFELRAEMASSEDANSLKSLADFQMPMLSAVAHKKGLGQLVAKLNFAANNRELIMSFSATETELSDLIAAVDKTTTPPQNPPSPRDPPGDGSQSAVVDTARGPKVQGENDGQRNPPSNGETPLRK